MQEDTYNEDMASILITCYSRTGKTKLLAEAIGRGAAEVPGIKVDVLAFNRVTASDFVRYDGIILGSPVYFGGVASEFKELIDDTTFVRGRLCGKVGAAFTTAGDRTGPRHDCGWRSYRKLGRKRRALRRSLWSCCRRTVKRDRY